MRHAIISLVLFALLATVASGADDFVGKAMKLYEKRHYAEAGRMLRAELRTIEQGAQGRAQLTLGMIYLKNAELHRALYQESLAVHMDYLKKLAAAQGRSRSRFVDLYMGEALLEAGKPEPALNYLEKFIADESVDGRYKPVAKAATGLCYAAANNMAKAEEVWTGLDQSDPEIKASLAYAFSKAGLTDRKPVALADESLGELKKSGRTPSMRHVKYALAVYAAEGLFDKGLDLASRTELKGYSYRESLSKTKIISFYDVSLLDDLSKLYLRGAIAALEAASEDSNLKETAQFYLAEAYAEAGNTEKSIKANAVFIASSAMPPQYRDKAMVRQAANQYQKGQQSDAISRWNELSKKQPEDAELLSEILFMCSRLHIDCAKIAQQSARAAEAGEGKRFSNLNIGLGRYYLGKKDYAKAAAYLEAGRDKGNKNKIEANDPAMLVNLANAYYRSKKFSEALEIYFEMSKQFPEVRQLQEALQGIYAIEHKSAGDVKIN